MLAITPWQQIKEATAKVQDPKGNITTHMMHLQKMFWRWQITLVGNIST